jgi:hypothetical protein
MPLKQGFHPARRLDNLIRACHAIMTTEPLVNTSQFGTIADAATPGRQMQVAIRRQPFHHPRHLDQGGHATFGILSQESW